MKSNHQIKSDESTSTLSPLPIHLSPNSTPSPLNSQFLGIGWAFPPAFIKNTGVETVSYEEDIRQSLAILFTTIPGERISDMEYGSHIHRWAFEKMDLSTKTLINESIRKSILYFEPRITLEKVEVEIKDPLEGILWINMEYTVRLTNTRSNMVYPFYFQEGTNL
ncbi:MAG: GPW/gp25 family protein [Bacteroidales bacterium]|jgi:phage baseplate assembly protein W|nr:GPW/gp25 family protein [Bacteroidales bacterium]